MTARGSAWDGGGPFDPPTAPLPPVDYWGDVSPGYAAPAGWQAPEAPQALRPRRRGLRLLRRLMTLVVVLVVLAALALGALLLVTPSVANAPTLARQQDVAHHSVYPGPPVPARFAAALVATEDHRFYSEPGIDPLAVARVVEAAVTGQGDQGGATLDQQLAKLLYTDGKSGVPVKAEQVGLAVKLYLSYSHPQILQMYADVAYFGHGYYGLSAASCGYFGIPSAGLSWPEAAMLAGLVQGPSTDDPILHFARARAREQHVLGRLVATGTLTEAQANTAYSQQLRLVGGSGGACRATP
ncbi:MAG: monofunctional glycosyltransferase [Streptosporangiaceae bacterium]|jgi:membrane peptidoglycan carboxypeptidase|nr:monofunctional glycosyltransferase [Streptosporangiaceae bacterium]